MLNLEQLTKLAAENKLIGFFDVEESAYHAGPGISQSTLKAFKRSPAHAKVQMNKKHAPTAAMKFGTAVHCALLEPTRFASHYVVAPGIKRNSNAGKEAYAAWESENKGKEIIDADDLILVKAMRDSVLAHKIAAKLTAGIVEKAAYWIDEQTGILCKCKPDAMVIEEGVILDIKSTSDDAMDRDFSKAIGNYGYHVQAAFYLEGVSEASKQALALQSVNRSIGKKFDRFVFLAIENEDPHGIGLFELASEDLAKGRELFRKYLQELAICQMENHWPSYRHGIQTVRLPAWAV